MWVGMSREEVRSRLSRQMDTRGFQLVLSRLDTEQGVQIVGSRLALAAHTPTFTPEQRKIADGLEAGLLADPYNAPSYADLCARGGFSARAAQEVWEALIENGTVIRIAPEVFLHRHAVSEAIARVRTYLREQGQMTAGQFRDLLGTSRKFAVPLMEYLDAQRVTRRVGDVRELMETLPTAMR